MNEINLFDAISEINSGLIEKYSGANIDPAKRRQAAKRKRTIRAIVCAAVAFLVIAGTAAVIYVVKIRPNNQSPHNGSRLSEGYGSLLNKHVPLSDVYYNGDETLNEVPADQAKYIFGDPSQEGLKYVGLWINEESMQAIQFNEDGTAIYYLLILSSAFDQAERCYFDISDGILTLYDIDSKLYGSFNVSFHDTYITVQPEGEKVMVFKKEETALEDKRTNFGMNDAMSFRNIPWTYDEEKLQIIFGGNAQIVFYRTDTETRTDTKYTWDASTDTVTFPDWHDPEGKSWTGRIEDKYLVITSGGRSITLYDPYELRDKSFPINVFLNCCSDYYSNQMIVFRPDGVYKIILAVKGYDINDESSWFYCYSGRYELEGTPEDADGKYVTIYPSGEDCSFLSQGFDLRFFADYANQDGERFLFRREGDCLMFILKEELGTLTIKLFPSDRQ